MATAKPTAKPRTRSPGRKPNDSQQQKRVTSERISADLIDFKKAGGRVEILGVTRVLTRVDGPAPAATEKKAAK